MANEAGEADVACITGPVSPVTTSACDSLWILSCGGQRSDARSRSSAHGEGVRPWFRSSCVSLMQTLSPEVIAVSVIYCGFFFAHLSIS